MLYQQLVETRQVWSRSISDPILRYPEYPRIGREDSFWPVLVIQTNGKPEISQPERTGGLIDREHQRTEDSHDSPAAWYRGMWCRAPIPLCLRNVRRAWKPQVPVCPLLLSDVHYVSLECSKRCSDHMLTQRGAEARSQRTGFTLTDVLCCN
jgi:hypothetical protein